MLQRALNEIIGVWLALAPLVRMDVSYVKLNNLVMGVIAAVVSAYTPMTERNWVSCVGLGAGAWVAVSSPFQLFATGEGYMWNNLISGALIFISGCLAPAGDPAGKEARRRAEPG